jgi:lantibiotic modifying enzyme
MGTFLEREELVDVGARLASCVTQSDIIADTTYDIVGGSAGLIIALLTVYDEQPEKEYLELARACGEHLIQDRTETKDGYRVWCSKNEPLAGFGHGAAGIANALLRLYDTTGTTQFYGAACEAIEFENSIYSPEEKNWPDLRPGVPHRFMDGWCHGRSGIGLARASLPESVEAPRIRQDLRDAIRGIPTGELLEKDHVCCGNFSRVEFLNVVSCRSERPSCREAAQSIASNVLHRVEETGTFHCLGHTGRIYNPGFFRGTAGIGYSLLRLESPEILPSVLIFE